MRTCVICKIEKPLNQYYRRKEWRETHRRDCKECVRTKNRLHSLTNRPQRIKNYNNKRSEKLTKKKEYRIKAAKKIAKYIKNSKHLFAKYQRDRKNRDPLFRLIHSIRVRTNSIFKSKNLTKNQGMKDYLGCTDLEVLSHIESLFTGEMSWENKGKYWELDHIIPLALADTEEEIYKLSHYTNLQPLSKEDHRKKTNDDLSLICKNRLAKAHPNTSL